MTDPKYTRVKRPWPEWFWHHRFRAEGEANMMDVPQEAIDELAACMRRWGINNQQRLHEALARVQPDDVATRQQIEPAAHKLFESICENNNLMNADIEFDSPVLVDLTAEGYWV